MLVEYYCKLPIKQENRFSWCYGCCWKQYCCKYKMWWSYESPTQNEWGLSVYSVLYIILCTLVCKAPSHLQWRKIFITVIFMKMFLLGSFVLSNICKFKLRVLWKIVIGWYSTHDHVPCFHGENMQVFSTTKTRKSPDILVIPEWIF